MIGHFPENTSGVTSNTQYHHLLLNSHHHQIIREYQGRVKYFTRGTIGFESSPLPSIIMSSLHQGYQIIGLIITNENRVVVSGRGYRRTHFSSHLQGTGSSSLPHRGIGQLASGRNSHTIISSYQRSPADTSGILIGHYNTVIVGQYQEGVISSISLPFLTTIPVIVIRLQ